MSTFSIFQIFFLIPKVQEIILADLGTLSGELQEKLGLKIKFSRNWPLKLT